MYNIELEIPDVTIAGTTIKRKAKLFTMTYNLTYKTLALSWEVSHYANDNGAYGLPLSFIPNYSKENIADNTTIVNPSTGAFLTDADLYTDGVDADGNPIKVSTNVPQIGQFDWFNNLGENAQINVHDLIKQYGNAYSKWDK
jgi:hypothetical protein